MLHQLDTSMQNSLSVFFSKKKTFFPKEVGGKEGQTTEEIVTTRFSPNTAAVLCLTLTQS